MPLSDTTPQVILVSDESNAINLAVSGAIPDGTPGILLAGITNNNTASFVQLDSDGRLFITGSVSANFSGTQTVTGSIEIVGIPAITGSVEIVGIPRITGSVGITNVINTTFAGIRNVATPVTAALVAGTDGTLLRGLLTDTSGRLSVNINGGTVVTNPPYDGTINAAAPSVAVLIAGRDVGGVLRAVRTDTTGSVFVSGSVQIINNNSLNPFWVTGSTQTTVVFPSTQSVDITNALLPVSVSNFPIFQQITGSVSILENNVFNPFWVTGSTTTTISFPLTQSVDITNTLLPVSVSNFPSIQNITGSTFVLNQTNTNPAWITGSATINNFPSVQTVTGTVAITANNSDNPFWVTGSTTTAISFPLTQSVFVTNQTNANPAWVTGSVTINNFPSVQTVTGTVAITANNSGNPFWITGSTTTTVSFPLTQSITGSVTVNNFPLTQSIIGSVQIIGIPTVTGSVFVLNQTQANPSWITGSVTSAVTFPSVQTITGSTTVNGLTFASGGLVVYLSNSITQPVTGTITVNNFPTIQTITGSAFVINQTQANPGWITGSTTVNGLSFASGGLVVYVSGTVTQPVTGTITVNNFPATQQITGSVQVVGLPTITGSVFVINQTPLNPGWITGSVTTVFSDPAENITGSVLPSRAIFIGGSDATNTFRGLSTTTTGILNVTGSATINNFPSVQTVTGTVAITANNSGNPFWITGSTTTSISLPLTQSITGSVQIVGLPVITGSVFVLNQTQANPAWITGSVTSTTAIPSIKVTGSSVPLSASYIAGVDNTGLLKGLSVTTGGILNVTGSTQIVGIPTVTGSFFILNQTPTNPAWVTGSVALLGSITATNPSVGVSGSAAPTTASFIAGRDGSNILRPLLTDTIGRQINSSEVPWGGATAIPDRLTMIGGFYGGTATATAWSMDVFGRGLLHFETTNGGALFENTVVPVAGLDDQSVVRSVSTDRIGIQHNNPFGRYETFAASTQGTVSTGTAAATVTSILTIFKSSASALTTEIRRIVVSSGGGAAGNFNFRGCFITAEGAAGTAATELALNQADGLPVSTVKINSNAPTRTTGDIITVAMGGASTGAPFDLFNSNHAGKPIVLRPSTNEGFEIRTAIVTALTTAAQVAVTIYWVEY